jgi:uncharacterized protein YlxW (UPF0749 family)
MSSPGYAAVKSNNNVITMSVEDANDLYNYIDKLQQKVSLLEERLQSERESTDKYIMTVEQERQAWENLERSMNAELRQVKMQRWKYGFVGALIGGIVIAITD